MPTNPNMVAIQTVTVGSGGAATIDFTNIPQTYTDLVVQYSTRVTGSGNSVIGYFRFNGNSANYSWRRLRGDGTSAASATNSATTEIYGFYSSAASDTANTFSNNLLYIPNYTSSNNKSVSCDTASENNGTEAYAGFIAGLWSNSAAITQITFYPNSGDFTQYSTATLYGVTSSAYGAKATGGIITETATHYIHTFLASGTFTPTQNLTADYLVVAGGGGGGDNNHGGGGGAGGVRSTVTATGGGGSLESALSLTANTNYTVTIGAGGNAAPTGGNDNGSQGSNSVFASITATGGGYGAGYNNIGGSGGSGGGSGGNQGTKSTVSPSGQGNIGGAYGPASNGPGSGGGGAGATGGNGSGTYPNGSGGAGGNGVAVSITGSSVTYGGGGGGGSNSGISTRASGGTGGGGFGGAGGSGGTNGTAGTANTGGGGGGGGGPSPGAASAGGSGIVIVRYAK